MTGSSDFVPPELPRSISPLLLGISIAVFLLIVLFSPTQIRLTVALIGVWVLTSRMLGALCYRWAYRWITRNGREKVSYEATYFLYSFLGFGFMIGVVGTFMLGAVAMVETQQISMLLIWIPSLLHRYQEQQNAKRRFEQNKQRRTESSQSDAIQPKTTPGQIAAFFGIVVAVAELYIIATLV